MIAETSVPTLLEDWQHRRAQLAAGPGGCDERTIALLKVLDYLIRRYEESDMARQPARRPVSRATLLNTRAMVVHHHVWSGVVAGVKSGEQARERMANVLHRMEESSRRRSAEDVAIPPDSEDMMGEVEGVSMPRFVDRERTLAYTFTFGTGEYWAIRNCLAVSPYLPKRAVEFLTGRISLASIHDKEAVVLLARCGSRHVFELAAAALGERIEKVGSDEIVEAAAALLRNPRIQNQYYPQSVKVAQSRLRERLASEDSAERLTTIKVLALIGDLHDVSLLTDLAVLCQDDVSFAKEHAAIVAAIAAISRRANG